MKNFRLLTTLLIGSLLLAGCNTNYLTQNETSENDNQLSMVEDSNQTKNNISLREKLLNQFEWVDIASLDKDEQYIFNMIKYPLCEHQEVYVNPRLITDVVENCTKKKKTWDYADGYGWVFPYWYTYDKNVDEILLLEFIDDYYNANYYWNWIDNNIEKVCIDITDWNFMYGKIMTWNDILVFEDLINKHPWAEYALNKAFKSWFIIEMPYYIEPSMCSQWDKDCELMYSYWGWSDDKWNYFAAWKIPFYRGHYYVINDYLLDPWHWDDYSYYDTQNNNLTRKSMWYFWWVENDKIIVKRFVDYRSTWKDISYTNEFWDEYYRIGSEFSIETCEIPFSKLEHNKMRVMNS